MKEKDIERKLVDEIGKCGGKAVKFVSPGFDGMPDRLVLMPGGRCFFVELKASGKKPGALQMKRHRMLQGLGFRVYVADTYESVTEVVDEIRTA